MLLAWGLIEKVTLVEEANKKEKAEEQNRHSTMGFNVFNCSRVTQYGV